MAYRRIDSHVKVLALQDCLHLRNVSKVAEKHRIDPDTIRNIFKEKIISHLEVLVTNEKPGPKPQEKVVEKTPFKKNS